MQFPAVLSVEMDDGTVFEERVLVNRGGPGNPLTDGELRTKFRINAERALPAGRVQELAAACDAIADAPGVAGLLDLTRSLRGSSAQLLANMDGSMPPGPRGAWRC